MLQGKQIDRMVAKVMRLGEVYSPYLIEERITPQVYITENGKTRAISAGDKWGGEFRCATFTFTVPALGPFKYYVCADTGAPEHLVCVNGVKVGMLDYIDSAYDKFTRAHRYVLLENLKSGDCVSLEGYWSHTIYGNMPYDKKSTFSLGGYYPDRAFDKIELVRFNERLKLFSDKLEQLNILYRVCGDRERARIEEVYTALFGILPADSVCPPDGLLDKAVGLIDKYLGAIVPREFPYVGLIGHSHLDTVWLWTLEETRRKYLRTVSNAVTLLDRYPDYTFFFSTVLYLKWLEDDDPSLFEKVVALIKEGRFEANGWAWVECDCNLTGGEALCRQLVRGIRWLREKTGYVPDTLWLPDAFGYSSALPQIMQSVQGSRSSALRRIRIGCRKPAVLTGQVVFLPGIFFIFSPAKFRTAEYDVLPAVIHLPPDTQPCFRYYCTETEPFLFAVKHHRIVPFWICTGHFFSFSTGIRNAVIVGGQQSGKRGNDKRMHRNSFQPDFYQCLSSASVRIFNGSDSQKEEKLLDFFQVVRIFL